MPTERVIEIPWALMQLPQVGHILDVGSCAASYLRSIQQSDRTLHCLDPLSCPDDIPPGAEFYRQSLIGNSLTPGAYDAVLMLSVLEHVGLPCYGQTPFPNGDQLAVAEAWRLLKPGCPLIVTVPAGLSKLVSWYRQYSPAMLHRLFKGWRTEISYWGFDGMRYQPLQESDVEKYDYREYPHTVGAGAGAVAGITAYRL